MSTDSKLFRVLLVSPWFLCIFIIIPLLVILSITFNLHLPLAGPTLLLVNNICFAAFCACRLLRYLLFSGRKLRYCAAQGRPCRGVVTVTTSPSELRRVLQAAGYVFSDDGLYGEKRDIGYLGTTLLYTGMLILLSVGSWDNLYKFSGALLDGMGPATDLGKIASYRLVNRGPLGVVPDSLPQLRIVKQYLPDSTNPRGATEIALISENGTGESHLLRPGVPLHVGGYDLSMMKLVFEPEIVIKDRESRTLFDGFIKLDPLVEKRGPFSFYGPYMGNDLVGGVYFQPEQSLLMVVITRNGKRAVTDLQFQVDQQVVQGEYVLSCAKMGQWSEIHVVRSRHKVLLWFGGLLALIGLMTRVMFRPQRIWLEEIPQGCLAWGTAGETRRLLERFN